MSVAKLSDLQSPQRPLSGRVAIVTGSSSGIGRATALALGAKGARVVVNSSSTPASGEKVALEICEAHGEDHAAYEQADVADKSDCERLVQAALTRWGRLDILVNNAGTTSVIPHHDLEAATDEIFQRLFDVNVLGSWRMVRAAAGALREAALSPAATAAPPPGCAPSSSVVNLSSIAGIRPTGSSIPYAVSKAAVAHMTRLLANILGPLVRVNAVAPGLIDTPWTADWDTQRAFVTDRAPLRRTGSPEDVASTIVALTEAEYVTGEVVLVDGGLNLR